MNKEILSRIFNIRSNAIIAVWYVTNCQVKGIVLECGGFKALICNSNIRVYLRSNFACDLIQFNTKDVTAFTHRLRHIVKKSTGTTRRLKNISTLKTDSFKTFINAFNNVSGSVMGIQSRGSRSLKFSIR